VVEIPLNDKTADLGVAMKRVRTKRIHALYEHFPSLKKEAPKPKPSDDKEAQDVDDATSTAKGEEEPVRKKLKVVDETLPQREQYGSVVDYLEAKYVRGVMLGDEIDEDEASDKESVYSEDSWLDDSLLKRDVAEQVLSHSTQTKVGVENDDDDDFFVNVGNLEVEDNELMDYDPAEEEKAAKKVKKRKRSSDGGTAKSDGKSGKISAKPILKKNNDSKSVTSKNKDTPSKTSDGDKKVVSEDVAVLKQKATDLEATVKELFDRLVTDVKAMSKEDLPQKNKNVQVTLTVLEGKAPGDTITFAYVHVVLLSNHVKSLILTLETPLLLFQ